MREGGITCITPKLLLQTCYTVSAKRFRRNSIRNEPSCSRYILEKKLSKTLSAFQYLAQNRSVSICKSNYYSIKAHLLHP